MLCLVIIHDNQQKFSKVFSNIPLDFYESNRVVPLKYLVYFLAGINTE